MKKVILMLVIAMFTAGSVVAQNDSIPGDGKKKGGKFSSFIKRTGERATGINMTDEPFVVNPLKSAVEVEFVGAYGDPSTGKVSVVFKVMNKTYAKTMNFGGSLNRTAAFDKSGKTYKPYNSQGPIGEDTPKGIWIEVRCVGGDAFSDVPETLAAFELINMYCYVDANNRGLIEFRNIPIQWGVAPE